jgi:2-oxoisovalerate dehydrogenase E1 component subunit alpha
VDGNDPVASWHAIRRAMAYCREKRKPYILEATVSRLYGHSSSSGALRVKNEPDCVELFEAKLIKAHVMDRAEIDRVHEEARQEVETALEKIQSEARPAPNDVEKYTYANSPVDSVYPGDYTGLPS